MRRVVLFAFIFAALAGTAEAACPRGAQCGTVTVPLDHAGVTAGTLPLAYARVPATGTRTGTIVFLSGGPGQAAVPLTEDVAAILRRVRATHDLVTVDQRGTGESGAVECETLEECTERLGVRRAFYNTAETAHDIENLRVALGVDKLTLLGVSYGTKVAAEYARRYPDRTAAVVLDSPVPVDGLDALGQLRMLAAPRVLREVCAPGLCSRTIEAPGETLARAVARVRRRAVRGPFVNSAGRIRNLDVTESLVLSLFAESDANPALRAGLPAALASLAAAGDAAPVLHLADVTSELGNRADINGARLLATVCTEGRLPWAPDSPLEPRQAALEAYAAERAATLAPFSARTLLEDSFPQLCTAWPPTPRPEPVAFAGPNVPVLILSGREDLRTPLEDARRTAAQYPNARLLAVPGVGHSVLRNDPTGCGRIGLIAFVRGQTVANCSGPSLLTAAPYAPATIGALRPTRFSGLPGRTLSALTVTLTGIAFDAAAHGRETFRLPGLRAGYVRATRTALTLHDVEWIRGVRVSGGLDARSRGTVTVSGPNAAPGTVTYGPRGASGTLGGRAFTL